MDTFLRILLKASYYICIAFGILPVSYNNIKGRFEKSKALCFYNKLLSFIVMFVLPILSIQLINSTNELRSSVIFTVFMIQNTIQWMSFSRVYYSVAKNVNELVEILNEGMNLMKNVLQITELPIHLFNKILMKLFIIDILFFSLQVYSLSNLFKDIMLKIMIVVVFFITANKFFFNFYLMSLYFNSFLLDIINLKMQNTLKTIKVCRSFQHNLTKHHYEYICNDASDKIDEISIQYSKICRFVLKSSKLFPLAVINSLMYSFINLLCYWFLVFQLSKFYLNGRLEVFLGLIHNFVIIFYQIIAESINLFSFVHACDCMKLQV